MSLCIMAGGKMTVLAASTFTLAWTHSIEKTVWQEEWRVTPAGLEIVTARVKGSGAGMEPADDAVLVDGWWVYRPKRPALPALDLAASGSTGSGWTLCAQGVCREFGMAAGDSVRLSPCFEAVPP